MGTSRVTRAPPTKKWNNVIGTLKAPQRNAGSVINVVFSVAINTLPSINLVSAPIAYSVSEGLGFALDVKERGLEQAAKRKVLQISERYVVPSISNGLWEIASSKMDPKFSNSAFGRLAEVAFKKTMNQLMSKAEKSWLNAGQ